MHHMNSEWLGHKSFHAAGMDMDIPLVPAPLVCAGALIGLLCGIMIGYKKASMHGTPHMMGHGMHGMGGMHGMHGMGGPGAPWMARKWMMMGAAPMHHHHGYGTPPCFCGQDEPEPEAEKKPEQ